jgi:hypothetical protein
MSNNNDIINEDNVDNPLINNILNSEINEKEIILLKIMIK